MEKGFDNVSPEELENSLCQIGAIKAARVVISRDNTIEEVHILASPEKGPKQLTRDVESLLMAEYGLPINHKKVSIAQIGVPLEEGKLAEDFKEATVVKEGKKEARLIIENIATSLSGIINTVTVTLKFNSKAYEGNAKGPASQTGRIRLVALATLEAVEKFTKDVASFALEDVGIFNLAGERVAIACIIVVSPQGEEIFSGSAILRQNENEAIVRATLDAINRRFGNLIPLP